MKNEQLKQLIYKTTYVWTHFKFHLKSNAENDPIAMLTDNQKRTVLAMLHHNMLYPYGFSSYICDIVGDYIDLDSKTKIAFCKAMNEILLDNYSLDIFIYDYLSGDSVYHQGKIARSLRYLWICKHLNTRVSEKDVIEFALTRNPYGIQKMIKPSKKQHED